MFGCELPTLLPHPCRQRSHLSPISFYILILLSLIPILLLLLYCISSNHILIVLLFLIITFFLLPLSVHTKQTLLDEAGPFNLKWRDNTVLVLWLDMTFSEQTSPCWDSDKALASNDNSHLPKVLLLELEEEITALELQIMYLERHLLSLYRNAFQTHSVCSKMDAPSPSHASCCDQTSPLAHLQPTRKVITTDWPNNSLFSTSVATFKLEQIWQDHKSAHRSLADHLGAFSILSGGVNADRLSEDIVRCISSIYCNMGSPIQGHGRFSTSPTSSLSSSPSLFSSGNPNCATTWSWSPRSRCNTEDALMIHIRDIHLDDHAFNYAATMLQNFRFATSSTRTHTHTCIFECTSGSSTSSSDMVGFFDAVISGHWWELLRRLIQGRWSVRSSLPFGSIFTML